MISARNARDELLTTEIERLFHDRNLGRGLAGAMQDVAAGGPPLAEQKVDADTAE